MSIDINGILEARGILAAAERAGWQAHTLTLDGAAHPGWLYPIFNHAGAPYPQRRWKAADDQKPKYFWPQTQPEKSKYYFLPGLLSAIQQNNGQVYIASGEPDVLAYHAAGLPNVLSWFGETSLPPTLARDLSEHLKVTSVVYAPDRDDTGMRSAALLVAALERSDIGYQITALPADMGSKYDVNRLWIETHQDKARFFEAVWGDEVDAADLALYRTQQGKTDEQAGASVQLELREWRDEWYASIMAAMGAPDKTVAGVGYWHCPLRSHTGGDNNPSFRFTTHKNPDHPWPVCSCGIQHDRDAWDAVADALALDSWAEYKARKAAEHGVKYERKPVPNRPTPGADQLQRPKPAYVTSKEMYRQLAAELRGEVKPQSFPVEFPYKVLHRFGGFAQYMWLGKLVGIGGISGGGKTILMRCMSAALEARGFDVLWWGPEFNPAEYAIQDLQRIGGFTFKQMNQLRIVSGLMESGATKEQAQASSGLALPTEAAVQQNLRLIDQLAALPGQTYFMTDMGMAVPDVMKLARDIAETARAEGRKPAALFFDYAQLANMRGARDWTWGERVVGAIKTGCAPSAANLVGFVSIQSRKDDAEKVREDNKTLTVAAAQGLDEKFFNLYLTFTPKYSEGQRLEKATIRVEKNSMGTTGEVSVPTNFARLAILDTEAQTLTEQAWADAPAPAPLQFPDGAR